MARYTGPKTKIARKFGEPIFGDDKSFEKRNDYKIVYQPVVFNELLKIIENSIKNLMSNKKNSFQIMNLTYFPSASELFNNNSSITIRLTDLENKLVKFLIKRGVKKRVK